MCVIICKPSQVELPDSEVLEKAWWKNDDGGGFMYVKKDSGIVVIKKGFMTYNDFEKAYKEAELSKQDAIVYHFRIATAGGINPENTHPFPVSGNIKDLKKVTIQSELGIAHNGILPVKSKPTDSDTQEFIRRTLNPMIKAFGYKKTVYMLLDYVGNNKFAFLNDKGVMRVWGDFQVDKSSGLSFSNLYHASMSVPIGKKWKEYDKSVPFEKRIKYWDSSEYKGHQGYQERGFNRHSHHIKSKYNDDWFDDMEELDISYYDGGRYFDSEGQEYEKKWIPEKCRLGLVLKPIPKPEDQQSPGQILEIINAEAIKQAEKDMESFYGDM